jgi:glucokinase
MYVGGGIAPKILPALEAGFARAFAEKGAAFGRLLAKIPIQVILDPRCALYGAALAGR